MAGMWRTTDPQNAPGRLTPIQRYSTCRQTVKQTRSVFDWAGRETCVKERIRRFFRYRYGTAPLHPPRPSSSIPPEGAGLTGSTQSGVFSPPRVWPRGGRRSERHGSSWTGLRSQCRVERAAVGLKRTSASSGKIGRGQRVWPSDFRLALDEPGASMLIIRAHQSAYMWC
jgi:hypothetical protein